MNSKKIILIVMSVITIGCIIFGTNYHVGNFAKKIKNELESTGIVINGYGINGKPGKSGNVEDDEDKEISEGKKHINEELAAFTDIEIYVDVMGIEIETGEKFNIKSDYSHSFMAPIYSVENGKLTITQKTKHNTVTNTKCNTVITVPANTEINRIKINSDVGSVKIRDFDCNTCDVETDVGEINIKNMNYEAATLESNVGSVNVEYLDNLSDYNITVSTDIGSIKVDGKSYKNSFRQSGNSNKKISVTTDVGSVKIY